MRRMPIVPKLLIVVVCLMQMAPFYLALTTSFKSKQDLSSPWLFPIEALTFQNYETAISSGGVFRALLNSSILTLVGTALVVIVGSLAAYPLARRDTKFNGAVILASLAIMMIPPLSILVPLYSMLSRLGLLNTYVGAILPIVGLQLPLAIFLYTQFMRQIPLSLEEAATMDGAGVLRRFFAIVFPLLKPVTGAVVIISGVNIWNDYALSKYILSSSEMQPLAPAIAAFFGAAGSDVGAAVAGALLGIVPIVIIYLFLQKQFMKGMLAGSEK